MAQESASIESDVARRPLTSLKVIRTSCMDFARGIYQNKVGLVNF